MLFYGGGSGSNGGDPRHEIDIGVFYLKKDHPRFGTQHPCNPVITRAKFSLNKPGQGITPLSILESNGWLYMFCTSRPHKDLDPRIVVIKASVNEPLKWNHYSVVIDASVSKCKHNHGASAMINPENKTEVLVYFAACSPPNDYRIMLASVPLDKILDKASYKLLRTYEKPVLFRQNAKANYPYVRYDSQQKLYELWYSGHTRPGSRSRSCFVTRSPRPDQFEPAKEPIISPSFQDHRNDKVYATGPKHYNDQVFYSGRKDARGPNRGIFVVPIREKH